MAERMCCRCHEVIEIGEDFYSQDGEDSEEVYCNGCIDDALEHEWFVLDVKEKAEMLGFGVYVDVPDKTKATDTPIPGQMDIFGGVYGEKA